MDAPIKSGAPGSAAPKVALQRDQVSPRASKVIRLHRIHLASSMRLPDRGAGFFRTVGVVQHTTPVALQRGQLPGGGTGSHFKRRILQQSHAGRRLRFVPMTVLPLPIPLGFWPFGVEADDESGTGALSLPPRRTGGDSVCDMALKLAQHLLLLVTQT